MTVYDSKITSVNNDTSDDNEKVRKPLLNNGSPNNTYNLIYFVFLLFGIATLLPWNVFITAEDVGFILFDFKHPNNCLTNKLL